MNELEKRLAVLKDYEIMDSPPEAMFDEITRLTSFICSTPMAMVTLLDAQRQWFKSKIGVTSTETPIEYAFCAYAIKQEHVFLVPDASLDQRFARNRLVTGDPHIRFYAGAPLMTQDGTAFGTLCAIDRIPRDLSAPQRGALGDLSNQVVRLMEMRKMNRALQEALEQKNAARREVGMLQEMIPMCAWCRKVRDDKQYWQLVEDYLLAKSGTRVTHGICPECASKMADDLNLKL